MKVRHYGNSFQTDKKVRHHILTEHFGMSNTDKTFYRPDISSARALAGAAGSTGRVGLYDFNDGKDNGDYLMVILRKKGLDPTEISKIGEIVKQQSESLQDFDKSELAKQVAKLDGAKLLDWAKNYIEKNPVDIASDTPTAK